MVKTRATTKKEKDRSIQRGINKEIIEIEETGRLRKVLMISNVVENEEIGNVEMNVNLPLEARQKEVNNQEIINVAYEHNQNDGKIGEMNEYLVSAEEDNLVDLRMKTARHKLLRLLNQIDNQMQSINDLEFDVFAKLPYGETKLKPQFQDDIGDEVEAYLALPGCSSSMAAPQLGSKNAGEGAVEDIERDASN